MQDDLLSSTLVHLRKAARLARANQHLARAEQLERLAAEYAALMARIHLEAVAALERETEASSQPTIPEARGRAD